MPPSNIVFLWIHIYDRGSEDSKSAAMSLDGNNNTEKFDALQAVQKTCAEHRTE